MSRPFFQFYKFVTSEIYHYLPGIGKNYTGDFHFCFTTKKWTSRYDLAINGVLRQKTADFSIVRQTNITFLSYSRALMVIIFVHSVM